jgi:DNA repair protein RecN (Recombination protein N)
MLRSIRIRDFALIRELELELGPGLNLLTGETGSGKSILVDALGLLVGERASAEVVRSGCEQAIVEGLFTLEGDGGSKAALAAAGVEARGGEVEVVVRREIASSGRSRILLNGNLATLALLKSVGDALADIHGQHDHQALLRVESHVDFLDCFGSSVGDAARVEELFRAMDDAAGRLEASEIDEAERARRIDALEHQIGDIDHGKLRPGEREELDNERRVLANREKIYGQAAEAYGLLYDSEGSIIGAAGRLVRLVKELAELDARWVPQRAAIEEALYRLEDAALVARDYLSGMESAPDRLEAVEARLAELERLARRYGQSVERILEYRDTCARELEGLMSHDETRRTLRGALDQASAAYRSAAEALSQKRRRAARRLEREIGRELAAIAMPKTEFEVRFEPAETPGRRRYVPEGCGPRGIDRVEFLVSPNRGEECKPLARIASGGELSRIVLALKSLVASDEGWKTLVFDEVDAGIGGGVAEAVGRRLREIARRNQVLCVTHLPQIAAFASRHYRVRKGAVGGRTETAVELLDDARRAEELARMLGGEKITETTRQAAREMLVHSARS